MATSRSKKRQYRKVSGVTSKKTTNRFEMVDSLGVCFVPDLPLLESRRQLPSDDEIIAIGLALYLANTLPEQKSNSLWLMQGRVEGLR